MWKNNQNLQLRRWRVLCDSYSSFNFNAIMHACVSFILRKWCCSWMGIISDYPVSNPVSLEWHNDLCQK